MIGMTGRSRIWWWAARALLVGAGVAIALAAAEGAFRWVLHAAPLLDLNIYYLDAGGLLRMRPGQGRRHVTRHWEVTIAINGEGFRDLAAPVRSPVPPVLGLGDSFAFGWGVNLSDTYYSLLERRLGGPRPVRVVKAGIPGTGPGDQFRLLGAIWDQYRPQLVIVSLFVGNDFTDVQMGGLAQFQVEDGLLVRRDLRPISWRERWPRKVVRSSHLLQWLRAVQLSWGRAGNRAGVHAGLAAGDPWLREFVKVHLREYPVETARGVAQTLEYLDRFEDFCRQRGAEFVLAAIPRSYQVYPKELWEVQAAFQIPDAELDVDRPQRVLGDWARRRGAAFLDLLPGFRRHRDGHPGQKLYYYPDAHLNVAGHRLTGDLLAAFLEARGWPARR